MSLLHQLNLKKPFRKPILNVRIYTRSMSEELLYVRKSQYDQLKAEHDAVTTELEELKELHADDDVIATVLNGSPIERVDYGRARTLLGVVTALLMANTTREYQKLSFVRQRVRTGVQNKERARRMAKNYSYFNAKFADKPYTQTASYTFWIDTAVQIMLRQNQDTFKFNLAASKMADGTQCKKKVWFIKYGPTQAHVRETLAQELYPNTRFQVSQQPE